MQNDHFPSTIVKKHVVDLTSNPITERTIEVVQLASLKPLLNESHVLNYVDRMHRKSRTYLDVLAASIP